MNITEFAILKKMFGKGGGNASEVDAFVVEQGKVYSMSDVMREHGGNLSVRLVQTLPDNLIKSNLMGTVYLYIVESTGIGYADFGDNYGIVTAGQVAFLYQDGYDKGWTTDINSATEDGVYFVRKNSGNGGGEVVDPVAVRVSDQDWCGPYEITYTDIHSEIVTKTVPMGGTITIIAAAGTFVTINSNVGASFSSACVDTDGGTRFSEYDFSKDAIELPTDEGLYYLTIMG